MLINKDHLLSQLSDRPPDGWISVQAVRAMIEEEPEAVKTGEWIQEDIIKVYEAPKNIHSVPHSYFLAIAQCSNCNCYSYNLHAFDWIKVDYGHCPNCGARMVKDE